MEAIVQANYDGIDGLQIANLANPEKSPFRQSLKLNTRRCCLTIS